MTKYTPLRYRVQGLQSGLNVNQTFKTLHYALKLAATLESPDVRDMIENVSIHIPERKKK